MLVFFKGVNNCEIIRFDENEDNSQEVIEIINQSFCEVIVTIGFNSSAIMSKTVVPVIEVSNDGQQEKDISDISLSVAKILSVNNVFIWSKIRVNQSYNYLLN